MNTNVDNYDVVSDQDDDTGLENMSTDSILDNSFSPRNFPDSCGKDGFTDNIRNHPFKTSACLRGGGASPCADVQKVTVHRDQKSPL